ncbi:MAG: hypothetical protein A3B31_00840 [Candidatus Komeilibacteria bacterium RIFCSPLOWO2_01_FULL_53_11]|uniref:HD domain-containing protein n=1 Tax=Candidatus Komeilibacteria bacterium RIFCSPLOWO2_01_FULL_53_11 TaxID=1798552 RepID=A0A1G2BSR3_9BACT|nr:MAG: hypothetical protein A3B31_00840 [Candidatus Komeilibacteria bacterium RIFCSPLOWO2_01_FULL_53_11]
MTTNRLRQLLQFLKTIETFKKIERKVWYGDIERAETDVEHTWHLAMFLMVFDRELPKKASRLKMLKMVLIHDLVEVYSGDTFAFDKEAKKDQKQRESEAAKKLFSQLPPDMDREFTKLFNEYEKGETKEAQIVRSFDKIQPILQNILSHGRSWKDHGISHKDVDDYKRHLMQHDATILKVYETLLEEALKKELFSK